MKRRLLTLCVSAVFFLILTACESDTSSQLLPTLVKIPTATEAAPRESSALVTEIVEAPAAITEEVFIPAETVRYQTEDGSLFVVVTNLQTEEEMPSLPDAPEGQKYLVLSTSLANLTGEPILVEAASLTLIDQNLNRHAAVASEDFLRTPLIGAELSGNSTILGFVRFAIPLDATPYLLEWCPFNDCALEALQTRLP